MPKGYLIAHIRAPDFEKMQVFGVLARPTVSKCGGTILVTSLNPTIKEGPKSGIAVALEFENMDAAECFYHFEDYKAAKAIRLLAAGTDLILAEGM